MRLRRGIINYVVPRAVCVTHPPLRLTAGSRERCRLNLRIALPSAAPAEIISEGVRIVRTHASRGSATAASQRSESASGERSRTITLHRDALSCRGFRLFSRDDPLIANSRGRKRSKNSETRITRGAGRRDARRAALRHRRSGILLSCEKAR